MTSEMAVGVAFALLEFLVSSEHGWSNRVVGALVLVGLLSASCRSNAGRLAQNTQHHYCIKYYIVVRSQLVQDYPSRSKPVEALG